MLGEEAILNFEPTAVVHLAGVQIPTIKREPLLGVQVNLLGTVNVFEAVRALGRLVPVAYASSGAVLGPSEDYAQGEPLPAERDYHKPRTLYGAFKLCNEHTARIYWQDHGIPSDAERCYGLWEGGVKVGPRRA